jgi:hypothetical protein
LIISTILLIDECLEEAVAASSTGSRTYMAKIVCIIAEKNRFDAFPKNIFFEKNQIIF